jgi:hypothetical protein
VNPRKRTPAVNLVAFFETAVKVRKEETADDKEGIPDRTGAWSKLVLSDWKKV